MIFPSHQLATRVSVQDAPFVLRAVDGPLLGQVGYDYMAELMAAGVVCGIGSKQKLRYFQLTVDQQELERVLGAARRSGRPEGRPMLPLDLLMRMCSDRKTTIRQRVDVVRQGRAQAFFIYRHKHIGV